MDDTLITTAVINPEISNDRCFRFRKDLEVQLKKRNVSVFDDGENSSHHHISLLHNTQTDIFNSSLFISHHNLGSL
jgi:hypothetical protein